MAASRRGPLPKPRYRAFADRWEYKVDGKYVPILDEQGQPIRGDSRESERRANICLGTFLAREQAEHKGAENPVDVVFDLFLDRVKKKRPRSYEIYRGTLQDFVLKFPGLTVAELNDDVVDRWFEQHPNWKSPNTKATYLGRIVAALNWAAKLRNGKRLIPYDHPLRDMEEKPKRKRRSHKTGVEAQVHLFFMQNVPEDFRRVLFALRHSGTRPGMVCKVTPNHFLENPGVWVFEEENTDTSDGQTVHKTYDETGDHLIVPLTEPLVDLCKKLVAELREEFGEEGYRDKPLFRTSKGKAWHANRISTYFYKYRTRFQERGVPIPDIAFAYCYRHEKATGMLAKGESDAVVAAVLGQKGTQTLHRHYNHILAKSRAIVAAVRRTIDPLPGEQLMLDGGAAGPAPPSPEGQDGPAS